ncbi:MAG: AAA family ATPase [Hyphomicrobium sp.]
MEKAGDSKDVETLNRLLGASASIGDVLPTRIELSRFHIVGEVLSEDVHPPVDRETSQPLCRIFMRPGDLVEKPILAPSTAAAVHGLVNEWNSYESLARLGVAPARSCLLFGPPGTGKTMCAYSIAAALRLPVVDARIDGLISSFLGTTARNIANLFNFANRYRCVLLLDEFDAIAKLRDDPQEVGEIKRVVNSLLQNLDARADIGLTIAITNHHRLLDNAVWRRFENQIQFSNPDADARLAMVTRFLAPLPASTPLHHLIAYVTDSRSGSDVRRLCNNVKRIIALSKTEPSIQGQFRALCEALSREPATQRHGRSRRLVDDLEGFVTTALKDPEFPVKQKPLATLINVDQSTVSRWQRRLPPRRCRSMPNNPVQYVANGDDFLCPPEPGRKFEEKDFFENRDADFVAHRSGLLAALDGINDLIGKGGYGPATYVKVTMQEAALAKSYRPNTALLTGDRFPCVGAGSIGELFFFLPQVQIGELQARIRTAENTVTSVVSRSGRVRRTTTRQRCEVGAIESIEVLAPEDKRSFTAAAAVQAFHDPHTFPGYHIELFEVPDLREVATDRWGRRELFESLFHLLYDLGAGARSFLLPPVGRTPMLEVQLTRLDEPPALIDLRQIAVTSADLPQTTPQIDTSIDRHEGALRQLAAHPLVRRIEPPVQLVLEQKSTKPVPQAFKLPTPAPDAKYPRVGIIDSGIGKVFDPWLIERFDHLKPGQFDARHGSNVAGLALAGQGANGPAIAPERDGCLLYDLPLYPKLPFSFVYSGGFADFLEEVEQGIKEAKDNHGVRIFNMSINCLTTVQRQSYSPLAARLDAIADRHNVLIINSAGNLPRNGPRLPWQKTPRDVLAYFAARTESDTLYQPTESVRSLSVGALNCPGGAQIADAPTHYTRRGPGLQVGIKPDVVHYGGAAPLKDDEPTGLASCMEDGSAAYICGTSMAAPLLTRTIAEIDVSTGNFLSPRTLRAFAVHNAETPAPLKMRGLKELARQFAGYGKPPSANEMLETPDHKITMVFEATLVKGATRAQILRFDFTWPAALVDPITQACTGRVTMTLVYDPPLDPAFGAEFVRVNLDAALKQRQQVPRKDGSPSFNDQTTMFGLPKSGSLPIREKALIDHGLKWWPTKKYGANLNLNGFSADWRLEVSSLTRAESQYPAEGVPFALVLTIEDPEGKKPVFQTFRQYLQTRRVVMDDIRTAARIRARA